MSKHVFITVVVGLGAMSVGCGSQPTPTPSPMNAKWDCANGMDGWQPSHPEDIEFVPGTDIRVLRLHKFKSPHYGYLWKKVYLGDRRGNKVSLFVEARTKTPGVAFDTQVSCSTGKQDEPTYGMLAAEGKNFSPTSDWATYEMVLVIPNGTRELGLGVSIDRQQPDDVSVDIRSIEYSIH